MPQGLLDSINKDPVKEHKKSGGDDVIFTEEEERDFDEMKESEESVSEEKHSSTVKTSQITKESVKVVDGVKTTSQQMIVDGKLVSSEKTEEYVGSKAATDAKDDTEDKEEL